MVFLYYISIYLLKINRVFSIRVSEDIYSIYHIYIARDLRETRMYYRRCTKERTTRIIHQPIPHTYRNTVILMHVD